jgi:FkbM family methyltransferase
MPQIRNYAARVVDMTPAGMARLLRTDRATRLLRPLVNQVLPHQETSITVQAGVGQGLRLCILPQTEKYYWTGLHELHVQEALQRELRPGAVLWDVGAHIGFTSLIASRLVGPTGRVEAFEPFPPNVERLAGSVGLNGFTNVTVHPQAITNRDGTALFHLHESSLQGSLVEDPSAAAIKVACETLDTVARRLPPPDLIKVDAEGAGLDVLEGGRQFLMTVRPRLIVEFTTPDLLDQARRLLPTHVAAHLGQTIGFSDRSSCRLD